MSLSVPSVAAPGDQSWVARYDGTAGGNDYGSVIALPADGGRVVVAGTSTGSGNDYATVAYGSDGTRLWVRRYDGPAGGNDVVTDMGLAPSGKRVLTTGYSQGSSIDYATVAYRLNGERLWTRRFDGPGERRDEAAALAVGPDGIAYVTGFSTQDGAERYLTIAYGPSGTQLWRRRYDDPVEPYGGAWATDVSVGPGGRRIYVTGFSSGEKTQEDYTTLCYRSDGRRVWTRRYDGNMRDDFASSIALSPDGRRAVVSGDSKGFGTDSDFATVAYRSDTGARVWSRRYDGPMHSADQVSDIAFSPNSSKVVITGGSGGDFATVAYRSAAGDKLWTRRYDGPGDAWDGASGVAFSPDGSELYVTGTSDGLLTGLDFATIAYLASGDRVWVRRFATPQSDAGSALAVDPDGSSVIVTGWSGGEGTLSDFTTISYLTD